MGTSPADILSHLPPNHPGRPVLAALCRGISGSPPKQNGAGRECSGPTVDTPESASVRSVRKPQKRASGSRGKALEALMALPSPVVRLGKMGALPVWIKGGMVVKKGLVDYGGVVCGTGQAVWADAKECDSPTRFPVGNQTHFPDHQRDWLIRQGEAGALAGLVISATRCGKMYWLSWRWLARGVPSIQWDDPRMVCIGTANVAVDWGKVIEATNGMT